MKKLTILFALIFASFGTAFAQAPITGAVFATNPARFDGQKVTVKNLQLDLTKNSAPKTGAVAPVAVSPAGGSLTGAPVAPGQNGSGSLVARCNPPRGFKELNVAFIEKPDYHACFFMSEAMHNQLMKETAGKTKVDIQLTYRGDSKLGYSVTFYRLGK